MNYLIHIIALTAITLPTILGYNFVFGRGKILHFGPVGVSAVVTYAIFVPLMRGSGFFLAVLCGLAAAVIISCFFAWLALRLEADGLGILTIAVHLALLAVVLTWSDVTKGAFGIPQIPRLPGFTSVPAFTLLCIVIAVIWTAIMWRLDRSALSRSLIALAENRLHAEALGISRTRTYLIAFLIAGLGSLITNFLYPQYAGIAHPNDFAFMFLIFYITCVVAGGPGSVFGVTLSTILVMTLKEGLRFVALPHHLVGPVRLLLFGIILIVAVWYRRKELFPMQRTI